MKNFILKCLLFFAVFFILEKALLLIRNTAPERELDKRLEFILNGKINADILVLGSSRGARDIVASQMADSLHTTAYNLSYPGSNILFHEYLLEKLLAFKNKTPKMIVLAVDDPSEVSGNSMINFRLDRLYPLVKYEDVRKTLIEKGEKDKWLSQLFIVHQLGLSNFDIRKKHFDDKDTLLNDGSMPISFRSKKFNKAYGTHYNVYDVKQEDSIKIKSFENFMQLCRHNNIILVLALAPNFSNPTIGFKERMEMFSKQGNSYLMQYDTTKPLYKDINFYYDAGHLTTQGASVFTGEIIQFIRQQELLKP